MGLRRVVLPVLTRGEDYVRAPTACPPAGCTREIENHGRNWWLPTRRDSSEGFLRYLGLLTDAYRDAYTSASAQDGRIRGIAPVGDAWARAWREGVANPDPYSGSLPGLALSFDYQPGSEPSTKDVPNDAGFHHPSKYGAYLNGLVLFQTITGVDVRRFGEGEEAARELEIPGPKAAALQRVAWESVAVRGHYPTEGNRGPCTSNP